MTGIDAWSFWLLKNTAKTFNTASAIAVRAASAVDFISAWRAFPDCSASNRARVQFDLYVRPVLFDRARLFFRAPPRIFRD